MVYHTVWHDIYEDKRSLSPNIAKCTKIGINTQLLRLLIILKQNSTVFEISILDSRMVLFLVV